MKKKEKVILLQNTKWGGKYEIKEFARGFIVNYFLHPKAKKEQILLATEKNLTWLAEQKKKKEKENLLLEEQAQKLYQKINNFTLNFTLKKGKNGEPLGSVGFKEILQELEKNGFRLEKNQLVDFHPLHQLGENKVKVKLSSQLTANIKIIII